MTFDPSIILQSSQLTPNQLAALQAQRLGIQQARGEMGAQNALRGVFAQPGAVDAQGMPTPNTLARVMQVDPRAGMAMGAQELQMKSEAQKAALNKLQAGLEMSGDAKMLYDQQIASGIPAAQARANAQAKYSAGLKDLATSGMFSPAEIAAMRPDFDPDRIASNLQWMKQQQEAKTETRRLGLEAQRVADERNSENARLGIERDRLQYEKDAGRYTWAPGVGQDASGGTVAGIYRLPVRGEGKPEFVPGVVETPKGAGSPLAATLSDDAADRMADQAIAGDKSALSGLGYGNAGAANRAKVQEAITKKLKAQGLTGADLAARSAEYAGLTAGERATGTRTATLGMAANEAAGFAPQVLTTSAKVDRTEFPTLNAMQNAVDKGTGGEDIVRFIDSVNAFKNAYAQVVTRGGQSTDDARKRADEVISAAWSKGQVNAGIDQLMKEIDIAKGAPEATRDDLRKMFSAAGIGGNVAKKDAAATALPMVTQDGRSVPDASKLKDGQVYLLPDGQRARFDEKRMGFSVVQD